MGLGVGLRALPRKKSLVTKPLQNAKAGLNLPRRLGMEKDLSIGTWNVRTLYKGGALKNLIEDSEKDLKILKVKNWKTVALDRISWKRRAVEAANTCNGLLRF